MAGCSTTDDVETSPGTNAAMPAVDTAKTHDIIGFGSATNVSSYPSQMPAINRAPTTTTTTAKLSPNEKIALFRNEIGISPVNDVSPASRGGNVNRGIYRECCSEITKTKLSYWVCATVLSVCLLAQICIGATLTALGASQSGHILVAVFGAVNTAIASVLTYLQALGLPYRLLAYLHELKSVRLAIEQKERDFLSGRWKGADGEELDMYAEVDRLVRTFLEAREKKESNRPETYSTPSGRSDVPATKKGTRDSTPLAPSREVEGIRAKKRGAGGFRDESSMHPP